MIAKLEFRTNNGTHFLVSLLRAKKTAPQPPAPSLLTISYLSMVNSFVYKLSHVITIILSEIWSCSSKE